MSVLAYLDQTHYGSMTEHQFNVLDAMVREGAVAIPTSDIHVVETIKRASRHRGLMTQRMSALRSGLVLHSEAVVMMLEWLASRGQGSVRDRMVEARPDEQLIWDGASADALELAADVLDDEAGSTVAEEARAAFSTNASELEVLKAVSVEYIREQIFRALEMARLVTPDGIGEMPDTETGLARTFPSIGLHRAFLAHATSLESNDIADLSFICRTVPHFDVVAVDRKMHARLHHTRASVPPELAAILFRARIVRDVDSAITAIQEMSGCR